MGTNDNKTDQKTGSTAEQTRGRILEAAMKVFGSKGYTGATTRAIAIEAGVNEVTLFRHFGTKENLFKEVIDYYYSLSGFRTMTSDQLDGDYRQVLIRFGTRIISVLRERREIYQFLLSEITSQPEVRDTMKRLPGQVRHTLAQYFGYQMQLGRIRRMDPQVTAQAFLSLFMAYVMYETFFRESPMPEIPTEEVVAHFVDIFIEGTTADSSL